MPMLGFGTYTLAPAKTQVTVAHALDVGYRLIDTAHYYGNETEVGQAIAASGLPRADIFVTTKVDTSGYAATKRLLAQTLPKFDDYVDLVIIHWPQRDSQGTWRALEEAYHAQQVRAIGVSNFNARQIAALSGPGHVTPALDQIETHLLWQQQKMHQYLTAQNIVHESYSPLGEGMRGMLQLPVVQTLATKYGKSPAQVILRYLLQQDIVVIPKSENPDHIASNFELFDFNLTAADCAALQALDQRQSLGSWTPEMAEDRY